MALSTFEYWAGRAGLVTALLVWSAGAQGQYPGRPAGDKKDAAPVARATAVLEWTGDVSKPTKSRLVPIAVFDGSAYQPGALYLAQPQPLALQTGTVYQLEEAGVAKGEWDVDAARKVGASWVGVGKWKAMAAVKVAKLQESKIMPQVVTDSDPDKPTLHRQPGSEGDAAKSGTAADNSKPKDGEAKSAPDPDQPTLHKRPADTSAGGGKSTDSGGAAQTSGTQAPATTAPDVDPDRPTLHKHEDAAKGGGDVAVSSGPVSATTETDPDRPKLKHGKPGELERMLEPDRLEGLPPDMQQMAAVSDTKSRDAHTFVFQFGSPEDGTKMQASMEDLARNALAGAGSKPIAVQPKSAAPAATRASVKRRKTPVAAPPGAELKDEKFAAYELSYSGGSTLVLTAESAGEGDTKKYVTVVAQPDFYGALKVLMQSVTSDAQLDATPRMRLVDAVDTDGDNRAELIFELRGKSDRQFAIYRVAGGRVDQVFNTGSLE